MTKTTRLQIRVTEDERNQIRAVAESYQLSLSEFVLRMTEWVKQTQPRLIIEPVQKTNGNEESV